MLSHPVVVVCHDHSTSIVLHRSQAADRAGQEAGRVLSNPTGGADQSKRAAQQLADANSEVPNKIQSGTQKVGSWTAPLVPSTPHEAAGSSLGESAKCSLASRVTAALVPQSQLRCHITDCKQSIVH